MAVVDTLHHSLCDRVESGLSRAGCRMPGCCGWFAAAVAVSLVSYSAKVLYTKIVDYQPTWAKGGAAVSKAIGARPVEGANNVSFARESPNPNSWWDEGGLISRVGNRVPAINAVAGLHDNVQLGLEALGMALGVGKTLSFVLNVPGMPVTAAITYGALMTPGNSVGMATAIAAGTSGALLPHAMDPRTPQEN